MTGSEPSSMEAYPEIMEVKSEAVHEEVPKEGVAVKSFGTLKKRHGDRRIAVGHRGKVKERTQGTGGSRKKSTATCRWSTCCAGVTQPKGTEVLY
jgi:hypothetical protein